jgi:hypothetical protein
MKIKTAEVINDPDLLDINLISETAHARTQRRHSYRVGTGC